MKKNITSRPSVLTFAFLFSQSIIHNLYFHSGNAILSWLVSSAFLVMYVYGTSRWMLCRKSISQRSYSKFFAVFTALLMLPSAAFTVSEYVISLGTFADYYKTVHVALFALANTVCAAFIMSASGKDSVGGFAVMTAAFSALWVLVGFFGFLHTKNAVVPNSITANIANTDFADIAKNAVLITFDTFLLQFVFFNSAADGNKKILPKQILSGTVAFVCVSGVNMLKNLFMFGDEFIGGVNNPNLAAIRLIPLFELPEISVIVNAFAASLRLAVYICALSGMMKASFGASYIARKSGEILSAAVLLVSLAMIYMNDVREFANGAVPVCLLLGAVMCFAFFSEKESKPT